MLVCVERNERNNNRNTLYSLNYLLKILSKFIFTEIRASLLIEYIYRFWVIHQGYTVYSLNIYILSTHDMAVAVLDFGDSNKQNRQNLCHSAI